MQATLLGISIAIILALVTALVGPHFVDWTQYRARFESEATKLVGLPVRINGPIDARLLPTPTLTLGRIEIGNAANPQAKARELHAELALGALVRGEFRAAELRLVGPETALGLGANGIVEWPAARMGFDPDRLLLEKVAIEDGRFVLSDAGSGTTTSLERFWFKGDVRSLLGPAKGEGGFALAGERYSYRVAASRAGDDGVVKLKLGIDPTDQPLAIEADGAVRFDDGTPRFDGALTLVRPVVAGPQGRGTVAVPWRATAKVKAEPAQASFEQVEYIYGPEARALKLTGTAEFKFGKTPRLEAVLSARQADLDRALALPDATPRTPFAAIKSFAEPFATSYRPAIPVRLGVGVDAVTLGGGTLQNVRGDVKLDAGGWDIEKLEFRAPGFAQVRVSGRIAGTGDAATFKGPAQIDASDPKLFVAWLEGRTDAPQGVAGVLRAGGDVTIGAQQLAVERLKFEFDRKTIEGHLAYAPAIGAKAPRLDANLKAADVDVDAIFAFGRAAFGGASIEWPREIALTVDVGRANVAGIDVKGVSGTFKLDPAGVTFDRVRVADLAEAAFNLNGRMEGALDAPRGTVDFDVDARGLDGTVAVLSKYWPQAAEPVRQMASKVTPLKAKVTLGIEPVLSTDPQGASKVKFALDGTGGALRMKATAEAAGDVGALRLPDFRLDAHVSATEGIALVRLLGVDRAIAVDKRAGTLVVTVRSTAGPDSRLEARLSAGGLAASATGTARLFRAEGFASALDLTLQAADVSLLRGAAAVQPNALLPVALRGKLNATANELAFDTITGAVGGSPVRGKLTFGLGANKTLDGQIDAEAADLGGIVAAVAGRQGARSDGPAWTSEPFGEGLLGDTSGRVGFTIARATLTPLVSGRQVRGALRLDGGEATFEDVEGTLAGGRFSGNLTLRRVPEGLNARARIALNGADAAGLLPGDGKPALAGRISLQAEVAGGGLSPASLVGALGGSGTIAIEDAQLASLDPKAFGAAIGASERGIAIDAGRIRDIVSTVLDGGYLVVPRLDAAFAVNAGQARVGQTLFYGQGADIVLAGGADLAEGTIDARLTLLGPAIQEGTTQVRPEILVMLKGPMLAPKRTVDVAALSSLLMLRSVERQSRRLDVIEAERREFERRDAERREAERKEAERREAEARAITSTVPAALPAPQVIDEAATPATPQSQKPPRPRIAVPPAPQRAPELPPPLNIGPPPGAKSAPRPPAGQGAQLPPPPPRSALDSLFGLQR